MFLDDISRQERFVVRKDKDKWNPPELPNEWFGMPHLDTFINFTLFY